jgi:4a-hydroxytetrahydrobiopterin dehydratase
VVQAWIEGHPGWTVEGAALHRTVDAGGFPAVIALVNRIAGLAEEHQHHPDLTVRYRTLAIRLTTHDIGAITALDLALAGEIDAVLPPP